MILTVGHSTHPLEAFIALVRDAGVEGIADVRRHPGSRRLPWFSADALAASLPAAGLTYDHLGDLGGRRPRRRGSPNGGWEHPAFQGYADWMAAPEFASALERLERLARTRTTAVMCAEAPWWRCHRRLVADALVVRGWEVLHLGPDGGTTAHELTSFAVVEAGRLTYPPPQLALGG